MGNDEIRRMTGAQRTVAQPAAAQHTNSISSISFAVCRTVLTLPAVAGSTIVLFSISGYYRPPGLV